MNIQTLMLRNVFSHPETLLHLPERGIVAVTGPNGAGKSSIIEAPCVAMWGKTLRGTPPWTDGNDGQPITGFVELQSDMVEVKRTRKSGRTSLIWKRQGAAPRAELETARYDTAAKAQEALEHVVGGFDVWRRSRVFSSSDASHFTLATDAERKRLLETILALDRFDAAHDACKADIKKLEPFIQQGESQIGQDQARIEILQAQERNLINQVEEVRAGDFAMADLLKTSVAKTEAMLKKLRAETDAIRTELRKLDHMAGEQSADARAAAQQLARLGTKPECSMCGQPIDPKRRAELTATVEKAAKELEKQKAKAAEAGEEYQDQLAELQEEGIALTKKLESRRREVYEAEAKVAQRRRLEVELGKVRQSLGETRARVESTRESMHDTQRELDTLNVVSQVLGLKGVRAHVLGKALVGVEAVANAWLQKLPLENGRTIQLKLDPYTEKRSGGFNDAIAVKLVGAGGAYGYPAASGGERRRVDVALVFGFSAVAISSMEADATMRLGGHPGNVVGGTLFFDEVFDALDEPGVEAVGQALTQMAEDRAIVVTTHSPTVLAALKPKVHWHVEAGKVTVSA